MERGGELPDPQNETLKEKPVFSEEDRLAIGRRLHEKLKTTHVYPNEIHKVSVAIFRGIDPEEVWSIESAGAFPEGPIFSVLSEDARFVSQITYRLHNETGEEVLGMHVQSGSGDKRIGFLLEVNEAGKINAMIARKAENGYLREPTEVNYKALPAFIDRAIKVDIQ